MAKGIYIGENNLARKVKKIYIGVNGIARKVKKAYIGVNGIAKQFYSSQVRYKLGKNIFKEQYLRYSLSMATLTNGDVAFTGYDGFLHTDVYNEKGVFQKRIATADSSNTGKRKSSTVALPNGNILVACDTANIHYGGLSIYNPNGTAIVQNASFESDIKVQYVKATLLPNGNIFIAFLQRTDTRDPDNCHIGYFAIVDNLGNIIKSRTKLGGNYTNVSRISVTTTKNGNVYIAYRTYNYETCAFVIYDQNGNLVKDETVINSRSVLRVCTVAFNNGNVLVAYSTGQGLISYNIYDGNGNIVKESIIVQQGDYTMQSNALEAVVTNSDDVAFMYMPSTAEIGTMKVFNSDGQEVWDYAEFGRPKTKEVTATALQNGGFAIGDCNGDYREETILTYADAY